jgi:hypothetical protein
MYGILVVEDGNELYQVIGEVASISEAVELARDYERVADPEEPNASVHPTVFAIWRRNRDGYYVDRETLELLSDNRFNVCDRSGALRIVGR